MTTSAERAVVSAQEIDERFDNGEDILQYMDPSTVTVHRVTPESKKVSFTAPVWMLEELDSKARHLGISRNAMLNVLLAEALAV